MKSTGSWIAGGLAAAFLLMFLLLPLMQVGSHVFFESNVPVAELVTLFFSGTSFVYLLNSLNLAIVATLLSIAIALPLAILTSRYNFFGRRLLSVLILVPLIVPPFVGAIGFRKIFARFGPINLMLMHFGIIDEPIDWLGSFPFLACSVTEALHLYPIIYLNLTAALSRLDSSFEDAAASLGASPFLVFRKVLIPILMPALMSGAAITLIWAFTDLGTPLVFDYREVVAVQIFAMADEIHTDPSGYILVFIVLLFTLLLFFGLRAIEPQFKASFSNKSQRIQARKNLSFSGKILAMLFLTPVLALALAPNIGVGLLSVAEKWFMTPLPTAYTLGGYAELPSHPLTLLGLKNSIFYSVGSTMLDLVLGITIAWFIVRGALAPKLWDLLTVLPLATPGLVLAFAYLGVFSSGLFEGSLLDPKKDPTLLLMIGYAIRRLPFMVRAVEAGLRRADVELEFAANSLGVPPRTSFTKITLPLVTPQVLAGTILCFTFALLEVSEGLILANREIHYPITKVMYVLLGRPDGTLIASALGMCAMAALGVALLITSKLTRDRNSTD